ncbi:MAG TPA: GIY-YIG nuclease family protein [Candidatus Absconditabacterales bacterium]|nr:GIY-YIG nuclease family protein [Candidatus Absconditabacterales bacterium]
MKTRGVYILKGTRYYVGYTGNLELRLKEHNKGTTKTTRDLGDWQFVKFIECKNKTEAIKLERKIKRGGHIERWIN